MAKKKKAKRAAKKKTTQSRARKKKTGGQGSRKSAATKKPAARRPSNTSVDSLLKKFARDRTQKETQLGVIVKKRGAELQTKTQKLQEQITKVTQQQRQLEAQLAQLDQQRDREVKQLLTELGIKLETSGSHGGQSAQQAGGDRNKGHREHRLGTLTNGRED